MNTQYKINQNGDVPQKPLIRINNVEGYLRHIGSKVAVQSDFMNTLMNERANLTVRSCTKIPGNQQDHWNPQNNFR